MLFSLRSDYEGVTVAVPPPHQIERDTDICQIPPCRRCFPSFVLPSGSSPIFDRLEELTSYPDDLPLISPGSEHPPYDACPRLTSQKSATSEILHVRHVTLYQSIGEGETRYISREL